MRRKTIRLLAVVLVLAMLACQSGLVLRGEADTGVLQPAEEETAGSGEVAAENSSGGGY